jgi:8-oxo-dGTP pyrophosphatase MutT (NUDIX family)|tara:strand:- start:61 stop:495 length:435 start_codon:yes stop_codon:yes gene_type:complete
MNSEVDFAAGGIVLINNKILLVKNKLSDEYKNDYNSGFWGYPKGHLDEKETPIKAAEREVFEETGFKVTSVGTKPIAESRYEIKKDGKAIQKTVWLFEMKIVESYKKEPDEEIEEIAIVTFEEALDLLTYEEDKKILRYVFNKK